MNYERPKCAHTCVVIDLQKKITVSEPFHSECKPQAKTTLFFPHSTPTKLPHLAPSLQHHVRARTMLLPPPPHTHPPVSRLPQSYNNNYNKLLPHIIPMI
jgi:hypothetical protein